MAVVASTNLMMIRYFCQAVPGSMGDLGYEYLRLLDATGIRVRALPIGPAVAIAGGERRWYDISHLFTTPMSAPFVNVVCAPAGLLLGTRAPMGALNGTNDLASRDGNTGNTDVMVFPAELREVLGGMGIVARPAAMDVVYEPPTAFSGMWTAGCKNVAIVTDVSRLNDAETVQLQRYDQVICPSVQVMAALDLLGVSRLVYVPFLSPPAVLARHLEELCGYGTSATTELSPATDAPLATTWLRSISPETSSSRSRSSGRASYPPNVGTAILMPSPSPSRMSRVIRMWRSFTRSLAFWRRWTSSPHRG